MPHILTIYFCLLLFAQPASSLSLMTRPTPCWTGHDYPWNCRDPLQDDEPLVYYTGYRPTITDNILTADIRVTLLLDGGRSTHPLEISYEHSLFPRVTGQELPMSSARREAETTVLEVPRLPEEEFVIRSVPLCTLGGILDLTPRTHFSTVIPLENLHFVLRTVRHPVQYKHSQSMPVGRALNKPLHDAATPAIAPSNCSRKNHL